MSNEGMARITPSEARAKADKIKTLAEEYEDVLKRLSDKMKQIDDSEVGLYYGGKKPSALRSDLDAEIAYMPRFKEEINAMSEEVKETVATSENE